MSNNNICFVLMPFSPEFKNQWELAFVPSIESLGLTPYRGDEETLGTNMIMRDITKSIYRAKVIVADLTGKNPNVMYELGLAHAAKKPVIMLTQCDEDIPFDVRHIRYLKYNSLDLMGLQNELRSRLTNTISQNAEVRPDFFPELRLFTDQDFDELKYYRNTMVTVVVEVLPANAEIFFNDVLIGSNKQTLRINPLAERNTISCSAAEYYAIHREILPEEIKSRKIELTMMPRGLDDSEYFSYVAIWLRYRRLDPDNPVLMVAIITFLIKYGQYGEAVIEAQNLLQGTPNWFASHNQAGVAYLESGNLDSAIHHFNRAKSLRPDHVASYINIACTLCKLEQFDEAIKQIELISQNKSVLNSWQQLANWSFEEDPDFNQIKNHPEYGAKFKESIGKINSKEFNKNDTD